MMRSIGPSCRCRRPSARRRCCGGVLMPCASRQRARHRAVGEDRVRALGVLGDHLFERPHLVDMAAERRVIVEAQGEFDRRDDGGRRHIAEGILGQQRDVDHEGDAAARPDGDRRAARGHSRQRLTHRAREPNGILRHAGAQRTSGARHEEDRAERRLAVLADALDRFAQVFGQLRLDRAQILVEPIESVLLAGRRDHQHRQARSAPPSD